MNFRNGRRTIGLPEVKREATAGELRNPIVFLHSSRLPDAVTGFNQTFTRYARGWSKIAFAPRKVQGGENTDPDFTHSFLIRYAGWEPELSDFICWGKQLFSVVSSRIVGKQSDFLLVLTKEHACTDKKPFTVVDPPVEEDGEPTSPVTIGTPVAPPVANVTRAQNPFWEDAPEGGG